MAKSILEKYNKNVLHEEGPIDPNNKLRAGIVGIGWIAEANVESYLRCPDVDLVAFAEVVPGKAEAFIKALGIEDKEIHIYSSSKEMYEKENLDIVSILTCNSSHCELVCEALEAGVHVLCEKPMCVTLEEGVKMCKTAKKTGKIFCVGFQPRMAKYMQDIVNVVKSGALGDVYYIQAGGGRRHGIPTPFGTSLIEAEKSGMGALGDIGCYSLDMLLNAVGYPKPLTVSAAKTDFFGKDPNYYIDKGHPEYAEKFTVDDFASAYIRLEGGIVLDFRIAWAMHMDTTGDAIILGKKGGLKIPSTECWNGYFSGPLRIYHDVAGKQVVTELPFEEEDMGELYYKKVRSFVSAVNYGTPVPSPGEQILYQQAIIDGMIRSAELGKEVDIVIPEI